MGHYMLKASFCLLWGGCGQLNCYFMYKNVSTFIYLYQRSKLNPEYGRDAAIEGFIGA